MATLMVRAAVESKRGAAPFHHDEADGAGAMAGLTGGRPSRATMCCLVDEAAGPTAVAAGVAVGLCEFFVATTDPTDTLGVAEVARVLEEHDVPVQARHGGRGMTAAAKAEVVKFIKERAGPDPAPTVWRSNVPKHFRYIKIKAPADAPAAPPPQYTTPGGKGRAPDVEGRDDDEDDSGDESMSLL